MFSPVDAVIACYYTGAVVFQRIFVACHVPQHHAIKLMGGGICRMDPEGSHAFPCAEFFRGGFFKPGRREINRHGRPVEMSSQCRQDQIDMEFFW